MIGVYGSGNYILESNRLAQCRTPESVFDGTYFTLDSRFRGNDKGCVAFGYNVTL
jgi:hypothetical protein